MQPTDCITDACAESVIAKDIPTAYNRVDSEPTDVLPIEILQEILFWLAPHTPADLAAAMMLCRASRATYSLREEYLHGRNYHGQSLQVCNTTPLTDAMRVDALAGAPLHGLVGRGECEYHLYEHGRMVEALTKEDAMRFYYKDDELDMIGDTIFSAATLETKYICMAHDVYFEEPFDTPGNDDCYGHAVRNGEIEYNTYDDIDDVEIARHELADPPRLLRMHRECPFW
jgi:hypothetical protein